MDSKNFTLTPALGQALQLPVDIVKFSLGDKSERNLVSSLAGTLAELPLVVSVRFAERIVASLSFNRRGHIKVEIGFVAKMDRDDKQFNKFTRYFDRDTGERLHVRGKDELEHWTTRDFENWAPPDVFEAINTVYRNSGYQF